MSWIHNQDGYHLLFNRDERRTRLPAAAPQLWSRRGVRFLAPVDGDFGGTWLAVNEFGVAACVLNDANLTESQRSTAGIRSRGLILVDAMNAPTATILCERIGRSDLTLWQPFTVIALEPGLPAVALEWNGAEAAMAANADSFMPVISSSFDVARVRSKRRGAFSALFADAGSCNVDMLSRFHSSHHPARGAYSPCMHRDAAETVSFSQIHVTASCAEFIYHPAAPCQVPDASSRCSIRLPRFQAAVLPQAYFHPGLENRPALPASMPAH